MKTNDTTTATTEGPKPGNLSTRDLAKSLTKPATSRKSTTTPAKAGATTPAREPAPADNGHPEAETEETETVETTSPETETAETESTDTTETAEKTEAAESETGETAETAGSEAAEEPEASPENIGEAVSKRLNEELSPLIDELTKAGAKGALQILQKRIPKLVDQRDTERNGRLAAEEQNKQLRDELQTARNAKPETSAQPSAFVNPDVAAMEQEIANIDHWIGVCESNLPKLQEADGDDAFVELPDGKGGKLKLNARQLAALQKQLERDRTETVAERKVVERQAKAVWQETYTKSHTDALREYPWMKNQNSPEYQEMQSVLKLFPAFKQSPDYELAIGDFIAGKALREARAKAKNGTQLKKAAPAREPTKVVAEAPSGSRDNGKPEEKKVKDADQQFRKSGSVADLARRFSATRRASRT